MSYALPGPPKQACPAVVQTYVDGYQVSSSNTRTGPAKPVLFAAAVCANGFVKPSLNVPDAYLEMSVCKGEGKSTTCFRSTLSARTEDEMDPDGTYAPTRDSVLFLEA